MRYERVCLYLLWHSCYKKTELGVEYISHSDSVDEGHEVFRPSSVMDWEEKDRNFQVSSIVSWFKSVISFIKD